MIRIYALASRYVDRRYVLNLFFIYRWEGYIHTSNQTCRNYLYTSFNKNYQKSLYKQYKQYKQHNKRNMNQGQS